MSLIKVLYYLKRFFWNIFDGEFSLLKIEMWDGFSIEACYVERSNWSGSFLGFWWLYNAKGFDFLYLRTPILRFIYYLKKN